MNGPFVNGLPKKSGWYIVRPIHNPDTILIRAFGNGIWWIDLGRGNGLDGWAGNVEPRECYEWIGPCGNVNHNKPSYPQAVRNLSYGKRNRLMKWAADNYMTMFVGDEKQMEKP